MMLVKIDGADLQGVQSSDISMSCSPTACRYGWTAHEAVINLKLLDTNILDEKIRKMEHFGVEIHRKDGTELATNAYVQEWQRYDGMLELNLQSVGQVHFFGPGMFIKEIEGYDLGVLYQEKP